MKVSVLQRKYVLRGKNFCLQKQVTSHAKEGVWLVPMVSLALLVPQNKPKLPRVCMCIQVSGPPQYGWLDTQTLWNQKIHLNWELSGFWPLQVLTCTIPQAEIWGGTQRVSPHLTDLDTQSPHCCSCCCCLPSGTELKIMSISSRGRFGLSWTVPIQTTPMHFSYIRISTLLQPTGK